MPTKIKLKATAALLNPNVGLETHFFHFWSHPNNLIPKGWINLPIQRENKVSVIAILIRVRVVDFFLLSQNGPRFWMLIKCQIPIHPTTSTISLTLFPGVDTSFKNHHRFHWLPYEWCRADLPLCICVSRKNLTKARLKIQNYINRTKVEIHSGRGPGPRWTLIQLIGARISAEKKGDHPASFYLPLPRWIQSSD